MKNIISSVITGNGALEELKLQLFSIQLWEKEPPTYYIFTDVETDKAIKELKYTGKIHTFCNLNKYMGFSRKELEINKGDKYSSLWTDLMAEKINCIRWAFESEGDFCPGVFFIDSDIVFFDILPNIPEGTDIALSPHFNRSINIEKYGYYNGGFGWISNVDFCSIWEESTKSSRFFEQAALEEVAKQAKHLHEFPKQINYGWWRIFQVDEPIETIVKNMTIDKKEGILLGEKKICCMHNHFTDKININYIRFSKILVAKLFFLKDHPQYGKLFEYLHYKLEI